CDGLAARWNSCAAFPQSTHSEQQEQWADRTVHIIVHIIVGQTSGALRHFPPLSALANSFNFTAPTRRTAPWLGHNMAPCLTRSSRNGAKITQHGSFGQRGLRAGATRWMPMASTTGEADHYSWFAAGLRRKTRHHFQLSLALRSLRPSPGI